MHRFVLIFCLLFPKVVWADWQGRVQLHLAQEFDSNAYRIYSSDPEGDFLTCVILLGSLNYTPSNHFLSVDYRGGAKLFYQTQEHLIANQLRVHYQFQVATWFIGTRLMLQDVWQRQHKRDYQLWLGEGFVRIRPVDWIDVEWFGQARRFEFRPDSQRSILRLSHQGVGLGLRSHLFFQRNWRLSLAYEFGWRDFDDGVLLSTDLHNTQDEQRQDLRHRLDVQMRYQFQFGDAKVGAVTLLYQFSSNLSNSYGSSLDWQRLQLVLSMQLPLRLTLMLLGRLQFTHYPDGILLEWDNYEPNADENENALVARMTYPLWRQLYLVVETALYRNAFHASEQVGFRRETVQIGLRWGLDF